MVAILAPVLGPRLVVLSCLAAASCAAPVMGLGTGALHPYGPDEPVRSQGVQLHGAAGLAAGRGRQTAQFDGSGSLLLRRVFSLDLGIAVTQVQQEVDGGVLNAFGAFPYLRPRINVGPVSIAVALAGLGFGGGGGGLFGGIADLQVGYGTDRWSVYGGAYGQYYEIVSEGNQRTSGSQLRAGGELARRYGRTRLALALELYRHHDELGGDGVDSEQTFVGGGLKLRVASPVLQ